MIDTQFNDLYRILRRLPMPRNTRLQLVCAVSDTQASCMSAIAFESRMVSVRDIMAKDPTFEQLLKITSMVTGLTVNEIMARSKVTANVEARYMVMYSWNKWSRELPKDIAARFQMDRTMVIYGLAYTDDAASDPCRRKYLADCMEVARLFEDYIFAD